MVGGELAVIDTEASRALHYAESFSFLHLPFGAPFSPDDYWEAISECIARGAKTIVVDSMSHEHEGPGGVLEQHDAEVARMVSQYRMPEAAAQFPAWAAPKAKRRRLIQQLLQVKVNLVLCFRAKKKIKMPTKEERASGIREPISLGWMPIAGEEFAYEMTAMGVLPPGSRGIPDWSPLDPGSELITKRPSQFEGVLLDGQQLSEAMGAGMARWASGVAAPAKPTLSGQCLAYLGQLKACSDMDAHAKISDAIVEDNSLNEAETALLSKALDKRAHQLSKP